MRPGVQRGLFWQVYLTLLASLLLVALFGAGLWHLLGERPMGAGMAVRTHAIGANAHFLGVLLTVAAIVGLAAYPVMSRITRRLEALRLSVEAWGGGRLADRAAVDGRDEIAAVAASFNAAADRVETLLAAHRTLLAHASHELRSPLARLSVAVEMLVPKAARDLASTVRREIAELDGLVDEILLMSRLEHAADFDRIERVDCLALAAEEAARAGISVREVDPHSPAFEVSGASRLLRRMIRNLIDNAVKHGAPPVEIAIGRGSLNAEPSVVIAVRDHGRGFPASLRDRVFEPFFRSDGWAEDAGSWGLGLALVRQIAERQGGVASCASSDDAMTTFRVELPARLTLTNR